jgi:2'-5' RNA ligase
LTAQKSLKNTSYTAFWHRQPPSASYQPHLSIAFTDMTAKMFYEARPAFKNQSYRAQFLADRYGLPRHNGTLWQAHK